MEHDRPNDQNSVEAAVWAEGYQRHQAIRELLGRHHGRLTTCDVSDVARELEVSRALCIVSSVSIGSSRAWRPCSLGGPDGAEGPASSPVSLRGLSARQSKRLTLHGLGRLSLIWSSRFTHDASKAICHSRTAGLSEHGWPRPLNANCLYARQWANALRVRAFFEAKW